MALAVTRHQAVKRGTSFSVRELIAAVTRYLDWWNERREPLTWARTPDKVDAKATRQGTSDARP